MASSRSAPKARGEQDGEALAAELLEELRSLPPKEYIEQVEIVIAACEAAVEGVQDDLRAEERAEREGSE